MVLNLSVLSAILHLSISITDKNIKEIHYYRGEVYKKIDSFIFMILYYEEFFKNIYFQMFFNTPQNKFCMKLRKINEISVLIVFYLKHFWNNSSIIYISKFLNKIKKQN